jgi:hypothetical protein
MKELLLYEDANEVLSNGLKIESGNRDLKNLQADISKELAKMKAKNRLGPDGVCISFVFFSFHFFFPFLFPHQTLPETFVSC